MVACTNLKTPYKNTHFKTIKSLKHRRHSNNIKSEYVWYLIYRVPYKSARRTILTKHSSMAKFHGDSHSASKHSKVSASIPKKLKLDRGKFSMLMVSAKLNSNLKLSKLFV